MVQTKLKRKKIGKIEFLELEMESSKKRERRAFHLEIDLTREKDSHNHKGGLGNCQWNQGEIIIKDIFGIINQ
jgi:hypothetical protein